MKDAPSDPVPPDDLDELYRRAAALDPERPSDTARRLAVNHAAEWAARRADARIRRPSRWYRPAMVGTLAAASLAGLLVIPRFLHEKESTQMAQSVALAPSPPDALAPAAAPARAPEAPVADLSTADRPVAVSPAGGAPAAAQADLPLRRRSAPTPAPASGSPPVASASAPHPPADAKAGRGAGAAGRSVGTLMEAGSEPQGQGQNRLEYQEKASTALAEVRDSHGRTPLMRAVLEGRAAAVDALLAAGADPNAADATGRTPLEAARAAHHPDIADALRRAGAR